MDLSITISPEIDPNAAGEVILSQLNRSARWGYMTQDFDGGDWREIEGVPPLDVRTILLGCFAKCHNEYRRISWWKSDVLGLDLYLYWDGDGCIVIQHADWMLENTDCKKSNEWDWVLEDHWSRNLPADYYK